MGLKTVDDVIRDDNIKKAIKSIKTTAENQLLIKNFEKWFNDRITIDGYDGPVRDEFVHKQDILTPRLNKAGWDVEFYTTKEWAYSMTCKDEYQYNVNKIRIKRKVDI